MDSLGGLLFPLLILLVFVPIFLSGRKQRRQMAEMQQLQSALEVGDVVTTTSGLRGTVVDVSYEETVDLEIAEDVVTTWLRAAVRDKVADTTAADSAGTAVPGSTGTGSTVPGSTVPGSTADTDLAPESAPPAIGTDGAGLDAPVGRTPAGAHTDSVADPAESPSDANGTARP